VWQSGNKLEFYPSSPGSTPARVKYHKKNNNKIEQTTQCAFNDYRKLLKNRDIWVWWRWGAGTSSVKPSLEGKTWILPHTQPLTQMTALPGGKTFWPNRALMQVGIRGN